MVWLPSTPPPPPPLSRTNLHALVHGLVYYPPNPFLVKKWLHTDVAFRRLQNLFPEDRLRVALYRRQGQPAATAPSLVVPAPRGRMPSRGGGSIYPLSELWGFGLGCTTRSLPIIKIYRGGCRMLPGKNENWRQGQGHPVKFFEVYNPKRCIFKTFSPVFHVIFPRFSFPFLFFLFTLNFYPPRTPPPPPPSTLLFCIIYIPERRISKKEEKNYKFPL